MVDGPNAVMFARERKKTPLYIFNWYESNLKQNLKHSFRVLKFKERETEREKKKTYFVETRLVVCHRPTSLFC